MKVYKMKDIEKAFTDKVHAYMNFGYRFNATTMGGTQGEIAKVDLTNDEDIIRIFLAHGSTDDDYWTDTIELHVERHPIPKGIETLWTGKGTLVHVTVWYLLSQGRRSLSGSYVDVDDYEAHKEEWSDKRMARYQANKEPIQEEIPYDIEVIRKVFGEVRGFTRIKESKIKSVRKGHDRRGLYYIVQKMNGVSARIDARGIVR